MTQSRLLEYNVLRDPALKEQLRQSDVELASFEALRASHSFRKYREKVTEMMWLSGMLPHSTRKEERPTSSRWTSSRC